MAPAVVGDSIVSEAPDLERRPSKSSRRTRIVVPSRKVVVAGLAGSWFLMLGVAWAVADPTPAGIDEPAHYIKALATGQGQWIGEHAPAPNDLTGLPDVKFVEDQASRAFLVPARLTADGVYSCNASSPTVPATCTAGPRCTRYLAPCPDTQLDRAGLVREVSYNGEYEPTLYLIPGLMAKLANSDVDGMRLARLGQVLTASVFFTVTVMLLYDRLRSPYTLAALFVAVSPMVFHLNAVVNPNGGEIILALCFFAALLRIVREAVPTPVWVWTACGLSGGLLGCARALGPVWVAIACVTAITLAGGLRPFVRLLRNSGARAWTATTLIAAGILADQFWWRHIGGPLQPAHPLSGARDYFLASFDGLPEWFEQQIGVFGWLDTRLGGLEYVLWSIMVLTLLTVAVLVASRRERRILLSLIALNVVGTAGLASLTRVEFGYPGGGMEGRYVLPFSVMVVVLAGEVLRRNADRLGSLAPRRLPIYLAVAAAFVQAAAFWLNSRRYAVGTDGPLFFLGHSQWAPPYGWAPWIILMLVGCGSCIALAVTAARDSSATAVVTRGASFASEVL